MSRAWQVYLRTLFGGQLALCGVASLLEKSLDGVYTIGIKDLLILPMADFGEDKQQSSIRLDRLLASHRIKLRDQGRKAILLAQGKHKEPPTNTVSAGVTATLPPQANLGWSHARLHLPGPALDTYNGINSARQHARLPVLARTNREIYIPRLVAQLATSSEPANTLQEVKSHVTVYFRNKNHYYRSVVWVEDKRPVPGVGSQNEQGDADHDFGSAQGPCLEVIEDVEEPMVLHQSPLDSRSGLTVLCKLYRMTDIEYRKAIGHFPRCRDLLHGGDQAASCWAWSCCTWFDWCGKATSEEELDSLTPKDRLEWVLAGPSFDFGMPSNDDGDVQLELYPEVAAMFYE